MRGVTRALSVLGQYLGHLLMEHTNLFMHLFII